MKKDYLQPIKANQIDACTFFNAMHEGSKKKQLKQGISLFWVLWILVIAGLSVFMFI